MKQYHPDHYQDNPLSNLAEEKMKEINEAYDAIIKMRSGGYQKNTSHTSSHSSTGDVQFAKVRQSIQAGRMREAEQLLAGISNRNAEWNYLMGTIAYSEGWLADAKEYLETACRMDPTNSEYSRALQMLQMRAGQGSYVYQTGGYDAGSICAQMACLNCLCYSCCN